MERKARIQRLMLAGGLAVIIGLGVTFEIIKVPMEQEIISEVKIEQSVKDGQNIYTYSVPEGYLLKFDDNGNPIGYTLVETEVRLSDYIESKFIR